MRFPVVCSCLLLRALAGFTQSPAIYEVVIHEIMPKPAPVKGLPPYEYIELRNISHAAVQLKDWRLAVNKREVVLPDFLLQPDSLLLLCAPAAEGSYHLSNTRGIAHFPALADAGALIVLYNPHHEVMHAVAYDPRWYRDPGLSKGGVSLEMIDPAFPCSGKINWQASSSPAGGTPGTANAAAAVATDNSRPDLLYAAITDSLHVLLQFSKTLDSSLAAAPSHYRLSGGLQPMRCTVIPPLFDKVELQLSAAIQPQQVYTLTATGLADCNNAASGVKNTLTLGLPQRPGKHDVVINELLFYPPAGIPEFIELYNGSSRPVALDSLRLCRKKADGSLDVFKQIANDGRLLMPGGLVALTTDATQLCGYYACRAPENIQEVGSLPSMPMAGGSLLLLLADSTVIDELNYTDNMQFPLASDLHGISLERLDYHRPSDDGRNWHSAAATAGYATPGWPNSQQWPDTAEAMKIVLEPDVFSPGHTGMDNAAKLSWQLPAPGYVANVTIFDVQGKPVRFLARNTLLGNTGSLAWDGFGENAVVLPAGIYIFFIEIFNLQGRVKRWKRTVVMARKPD